MLVGSCYIPVSNVDMDFHLNMKGMSTQAQLGQGKGECHTNMHNVMSFVLHRMSEFPYIMNVISHAATGDKRQFLKLIREGDLSVLDQDTDTQWPKKKKPPDLGHICIKVWIERFAK